MDNSNYYEIFDWAAMDHSNVMPIIRALDELIPGDVRNIIDIGCGNGLITSHLSRKYEILGVDRSEAALSHLKTNTLCSSSDNVPVEDHSFDLVLSTELLEHLEEDVFARTLTEFKRISRKYIMITVPNRENLNKYLLKCPQCGYLYNRSYHLRSFSKDQLINLYPDSENIAFRILGPKVRHYNPLLSWVKRKITPSSSWIPKFWTADNRKTMCPKCEHTYIYKYKFNLLALALDLANVIISRKKPYWQLALFKIKESNALPGISKF